MNSLAGAKLITYDSDTGIWMFETKHWSRYAMDDSDEEDDAGETKGERKTGAQNMREGGNASHLNPNSLSNGQQGGMSRVSRLIAAGG